jgi:beta-lactamase class A
MINPSFLAQIATLDPQTTFLITLDGIELVSAQSNQRGHIASAYKFFVALACARAINQKQFKWTTYLPIRGADRLPASPITDGLSDDTEMTVFELMRAMMAVSDNTATEVLQKLVGIRALEAILKEYKLSRTQLPSSLAYYYSLAQQGVGVTEPVAAISTAADLVQAYELTLAREDLLTANRETFWSIMQAEDRQQKKVWGADITCYRKSGYLEIPPFYAMTLAGMMRSPHHRFTFAFLYNFEQPDERRSETNLLAFQNNLRAILHYLRDALVSMEGNSI